MLRSLRSLVRDLLGRSRFEREMAEELQFHLERRTADLIATGLAAEEARRRARLEFGGVERYREECREARGLQVVDQLRGDLRYAVRVLRRSPTFALTAVVTLGLGIGANTAIFSLIDAVMLKKLPVNDPDRLVQVTFATHDSFSNPVWETLRDTQSVFDGAFAWAPARFNVGGPEEGEYVTGLYASGGYFSALGVQPVIGRMFAEADDRRGGGPDGPVAVIGHEFWRRHFAGSPDVIGKTLSIDRQPFTIIGVTPASFFGVDVGRSAAVTIPIGTQTVVRGREAYLDEEDSRWLRVMARLTPGQTLARAQAQLEAFRPALRTAMVAAEREAGDLTNKPENAFRLTPAAHGLSGARTRYRLALLTLMGLVALVLLIGCANVANLLLARTAARGQELAVRVALGASRGRLVRQLLTESIVLAALGAALALVFAHWSSVALVRQLSTHSERLVLDLGVDWRVLGFTMGVTVLTVLLFGLAPAFRTSRWMPSRDLKARAAGVIAQPRRLGPSSFVLAAQAALSVVLVVGAGLFLQTFVRLTTQDIGFDPRRVWLVNIDLRPTGVATEQRPSLYAKLLDAVRSTSGVASAASSFNVPISGWSWEGPVSVSDADSGRGRHVHAYLNRVSPEYFQTLDTPIVAGRDFTDRDDRSGPRVAIANHAFVERAFGGDGALGRTFTDEAGHLSTIVGIVADAKYRQLRDPAPPTVYVPMNQADTLRPSFSIVFRPAMDTAPVFAGVQHHIARVHRGVMFEVKRLDTQVADSLARERALALLSGFLGVFGLLLAAVGLYGVLSYGVVQRRREIGIRIALGAAPRDVVLAVAGDIGVVMTIGLAAGMVLSLMSGRLVQALLFEVPPDDPRTLGLAFVTLLAIAAIAAYLPARRAAGLDPSEALRME